MSVATATVAGVEVARFNVARFAKTARADMLGALDALPDVPLAAPKLGLPLLIVQDFAAAQQVLVASADDYGKPGLIRKAIVNGLGHNLFTAEGDQWLARRRVVAPVFAATGMDGLASIVAATVIEQIERWASGTVDMQEEMTDLTLNVACQALLGTDPAGDDLAQTIRIEFTTLLTWIGSRLSNPVQPPVWVPTPGNRAMKQAKARLQQAVGQLVHDRRSSGVDTDDVLGRLVTSQRETGGPYDAAIVDECIGFLFAGHETTASTLTWALYELARHPEMQQRLAAEGRTIKPDSDTLHDDAEALVATGTVVEETLRLYPAGISVGRVAKRRTDIGDHSVRRGTTVLVSVYGIQRRPSVWERPLDFDPDRPLPPTCSGMRDSFLAFGLGPRRCLGARFARTEMRLALAMICARWNLEYTEPTTPVPEVTPSLRVAGELRLDITAR